MIINNFDKDIKKSSENNNDPLDLSEFSEDDWTFKTANTQDFSHGIFNDYPARMIPQIARRLIDLYYPFSISKEERKSILDPFAGSGTTCVEAMLRDIDCIAFDLNPLANLIEKVRTSILNPKSLNDSFNQICQIYSKDKKNRYEEYIPQIENIEYWFSDKAFDKLSVLKNSINQVLSEKKFENKEEMEKQKNFFLATFGKTARNSSYQRKGEHKSYRIPKKKIEEFDENLDVLQIFNYTFKKNFNSYMKFHNYYKKNKNHAKCKYFLSDSRELNEIKEKSIDLIVTSPPYGDSHTTVAYGQFSRIALEWFLFPKDEIRQIDNDLLGGLKEIEGFTESKLLLQIGKEVLINEITQQKDSIVKFYSAAKEFCNNNKFNLKTDIFNENISKIEEFIIKTNNIENFQNLISNRDEFFSYIKVLRTEWNKYKNQFGDLKLTKEIKRFRVYDDRLGYVLSFFYDFSLVMKNMYRVLDNSRYCCIVVGNRTVKWVRIPTDEIMIEIGKTIGFEYIRSYYRDIPNKRMPTKNSPTNISGKKLTTIQKETILILRKL